MCNLGSQLCVSEILERGRLNGGPEPKSMGIFRKPHQDSNLLEL